MFFYILSASLLIYAKTTWSKTIPGKSVWNEAYWAVCTAASVDRSSLQSNLSFSMCACTDLHSALMFPSPKPVAPLRSISSKKKVSSVKMGFVNTWRRYLEMEIIRMTGYRTVSALCLLLCFPVAYPFGDHMQEKGKIAFSSLHNFCTLTPTCFSLWTAMRAPGAS